ncbi:MAG TPA: type II toxin-antitoxin system VapC family toxin [Rhizomicrobium sp.]|nr:type II toxin-antitoxin system VapC family toxin [Rhizomicrobium sp.]
MVSIFVDSNVILDVFTNDPVWEPWSSKAVRMAADRGRLVINAIVFAEISVHFELIEEVDEALSSAYEREAIPFEAAFLAGKAFSRYRRRGGSKTSPLSDFFIGAHAAVKGYELLTRDVAHYKSYFPKLRLIAPD